MTISAISGVTDEWTLAQFSGGDCTNGKYGFQNRSDNDIYFIIAASLPSNNKSGGHGLLTFKSQSINLEAAVAENIYYRSNVSSSSVGVFVIS